MTMMKTLMGKKAPCLALVPISKNYQCGGYSPSFVFYYNYGCCFNIKVSTTMGVVAPTLVFFFLLFIVGSPLRVPSFGDVGDGHNGFLLMCFTNGGTNDEKEKGEKKKKERGREPSMVVVMVEPISLLFLLICVSFSHFGYRCLIRVQIHKN
jgi:hypothetical protein